MPAIAASLLWTPSDPITQNSFAATLLLDAAGEQAAAIIQAPKTGNISHVGWNASRSDAGETLDVRLETVSLTTGDPTGTLLAANTNGAQVVATNGATPTWYDTALTAAAAVSRGDLLAVVWAMPTPTSGNIQVAALARYYAFEVPYSDLFVSAAWTRQNLAPVMALKYDDGNYYHTLGCWPVQTVTTTRTFNTSQYNGLAVTFPAPKTLHGAWVVMDPSGTPTGHQWFVRDAAGGVIYTSPEYDVDVWLTGASKTPRRFYFDTPVALEANTQYLVQMRSIGANGGRVNQYVLNSAALMAAMPGGAAMHRSIDLPSGADPSSYLLIGLLLSDPAATAGGPVRRVGGVRA